MKISTKKMALAGLATVAALIGTLIVSVFPVYAAPPAPPANGVSIDLERATTVSIPNGGTFTVNLNINPGTVVSRGFQAEVDFTAGTLTTTRSNLTMSSYWSDWANADNSANPNLSQPAGTYTPTSVLTTSSVYWGTSITGDPGNGPTGNGTPFVAESLTFTATAAANNSMIPLTLTTTGGHAIFVTGSDGTSALPANLGSTLYVVIGTLPALSVSSISTSPANGSSASYTLNFTVSDANATSVASTVSYAINSGTPTVLSVNSLAAGGHQDFSIPLTVSASGTDSIVVTADSGNLYGESNNTASISYTILPDLVVSSISTNPTSSSASPATTNTYTVSYTITNNGPGAAAASNTSIVINGGIPIVIACPGLANCASNPQTTGTITVTGTQDNIVVTADSGHAVNEWNENNNTATISYYFTSPNVISGSQDITGTLNTVFIFTAPAPVNQWTYAGNSGSASAAFFPGQSNINAVANSMTVNSNQSWVVTASGENGGYLSKWNSTSGYASQLTQLQNPLYIASTANQGSNAYSLFFSNLPQNLATGNVSGLTGASGYSRTIPVGFTQVVTFNDAALATGYVYHMTATYICTTTAY